MKIKLLGLALLCALYSCTSSTKKTENKVTQYTIAQFMDNEAVSGGTFSTDNSKILVSSNRSGIYNIYTIPSNGGEMTPITSSDSNSYFAVSYFPNDDRILMSADGNGDEIFHLFVRELDGSLKDITPAKGAKANFLGWSTDKKHLFFGSNKRDKKYFDIYKLSVKDYSAKMIFQNNDGLDVIDISGNEQYLAITKTITTNDRDLFLYDVKSKAMTKINKNQSANSVQDFSIDNATLYYTTDDGSEFSYLTAYDIETKTSKKVLEKSWDIWVANFSESGKYMTLLINEDGKNAVEILDANTMKPIDLPDFGEQSITSVTFSGDEKWISLYVGGSNSPSNLYSYNMESKELKKLTEVLNKEINPDDLVEATVIRFKSFDGTEIPAIYYLPKQATMEEKAPAMVWVHGGPGGQSRQSYSSLIQYMVNHGYAVLAVNNRGSSGYGKTFFQMDDLNHGDKDLKDCIEGKNWLATQKTIDADKIGIIGGSYGGFMTMAALTFAPEEFKVGVNIYGVTNWIRTIRSIPPWWESFKEALYLEMGDPYSADSVRLKQISPLFHTQNVTKPLMVLQGAQDPRVLQVESDEIVAGVKENGVPVEYVLFPDEGHGFVKKENQIEANSRIVKFLDKHLKGIDGNQN